MIMQVKKYSQVLNLEMNFWLENQGLARKLYEITPILYFRNLPHTPLLRLGRGASGSI